MLYENAVRTAADDENALPVSQGSAIDLTEDADDEETNAVCRQCNLPFFTASGNTVCVDCRAASPAAVAPGGRGARSALSPRSPNSVTNSTPPAVAGCAESATSFPAAAATAAAAAVTGATMASIASASSQADQAQDTGLGGWVYSAAAGVFGRLASQ